MLNLPRIIGERFFLKYIIVIGTSSVSNTLKLAPKSYYPKILRAASPSPLPF